MSDKNLTSEEIIAQIFTLPPLSNSKINELLSYLPKERTNNSVGSERSELPTNRGGVV